MNRVFWDNYYVRRVGIMFGISVLILVVLVLYDLRYSHFGVPYDWNEVRYAGFIRAAAIEGDTTFEREIRAFALQKGLDCSMGFYDSEDELWYKLLASDADVIARPGKGYRWSVRENSPMLRDTLEQWYDRNLRHISAYDEIFKHYGDSIGVDWKLLAAVAWTESRFNARAVGSTGIGLMQLSAATAAKFGTPRHELLNADPNVRAAARLIAYLYEKYDFVNDPNERIKFVIAAYNSGSKAVTNAVERAKYNKKDIQHWDNVSKYYHNGHSKRYLKKILARWEKYKMS